MPEEFKYSEAFPGKVVWLTQGYTARQESCSEGNARPMKKLEDIAAMHTEFYFSPLNLMSS